MSRKLEFLSSGSVRSENTRPPRKVDFPATETPTELGTELGFSTGSHALCTVSMLTKSAFWLDKSFIACSPYTRIIVLAIPAQTVSTVKLRGNAIRAVWMLGLPLGWESRHDRPGFQRRRIAMALCVRCSSDVMPWRSGRRPMPLSSSSQGSPSARRPNCSVEPPGRQIRGSY